ncbi:hypothetical protein [Microbacterium sp. KR10-403]|uniref:hypothetical protein n=1 Tax=Microbacterium sp. KR10-403 TaxID=3158581 RepID=UPI0032E427B5
MSATVTALKQRPEPAVWLSPEQVCDRVPGMTLSRLKELRAASRGPAYSKPTLKTVIYSAADIDEWVRGTRVSTREQA